MRLLNVSSVDAEDRKLQLAEFVGRDIPEYAILSHTWGDDEVLLADIANGTARIRKAFQKVKFAADQAQHDGYDYIWIDTCCIDKSSSAELREAINSMYAWYAEAGACYVYLIDVTRIPTDSAFEDQFWRSRWFTRGWTLQKLLAPQLLFFSRDWSALGGREGLVRQVSRAAGIDVRFLRKALCVAPCSLQDVSVAERMSWASSRKTTMTEDLAYCLMGIFDVNMPLLYSEGSKAFFRLQEEIMKSTDDHSLFIRHSPVSDSRSWSPQYLHGLLADAPSAFKESGHMIEALTKSTKVAPHTLTNSGVQIQVRLRALSDSIYLAILESRDHKGRSHAIYLKRDHLRKSHFVRIFVNASSLFATMMRTAPRLCSSSKTLLDMIGRMHRTVRTTMCRFKLVPLPLRITK